MKKSIKDLGDKIDAKDKEKAEGQIKDLKEALEKDNIEDEIADVLWVLLCIANQTGVNVTEAFARNLEKKTQRDNTRHINNPKLQDHGEE